MTTHLNAVAAGNIQAGTGTGQATAIRNAVQAVQGTMTAIGDLKEAEGLSDTVVDAIEILENAWDELQGVRLGTGENVNTTVGTVAEAQITNVTQEQVDTLRELN